jgi:hypothetical protein
VQLAVHAVAHGRRDTRDYDRRVPHVTEQPTPLYAIKERGHQWRRGGGDRAAASGLEGCARGNNREIAASQTQALERGAIKHRGTAGKQRPKRPKRVRE